MFAAYLPLLMTSIRPIECKQLLYTSEFNCTKCPSVLHLTATFGHRRELKCISFPEILNFEKFGWKTFEGTDLLPQTRRGYVPNIYQWSVYNPSLSSQKMWVQKDWSQTGRSSNYLWFSYQNRGKDTENLHGLLQAKSKWSMYSSVALLIKN